jgi:hypothetical protein
MLDVVQRTVSYYIVILNLFQDNAPPSPVILKQVQDDDGLPVILKQVQDDECTERR